MFLVLSSFSDGNSLNWKIHWIQSQEELSKKRYSNTLLQSSSHHNVKLLLFLLKFVWECLVKINQLGKNAKVYLVWIPGHSGIKGDNEKEITNVQKKIASTSFVVPESLWHTQRERQNKGRNRRSIAMIKDLPRS